MAEKMQISAVILAGGLARRLNGVEKGLQIWQGQPLISHILARLDGQVCKIWININRSHSDYQTRYPNLPQYSDRIAGFQGALSGMLSGFEQIQDEYLLFVPCDSPLLPLNLAKKLYTALTINHAQIAYAHDGERPHPTFSLVHRSVAPALAAYLMKGERRLLHFFLSQKSVAVDFSSQKQAFRNFNTPDDFNSGMVSAETCKIPLLAITGYSGTGKTTLLEKLIPRLTEYGLRVALIKHSHHNIDVDKAGKDSYRLRTAGANPTMILCEQRWAMMVETHQPMQFEQAVEVISGQNVDLILVEGFKHERLAKIQLHRQSLAKPLPACDAFTLAIATDYPLDCANHLDLNNIEQITTAVISYVEQHKKGTLHLASQ